MALERDARPSVIPMRMTVPGGDPGGAGTVLTELIRFIAFSKPFGMKVSNSQSEKKY